jgi:hypothetical protein
MLCQSFFYSQSLIGGFMSNSHFHVIPAEPGHFVVIDLKEKRELAIGGAVIAWRFETGLLGTAAEVSSRCVPLTMQGDATENAIGVLHPDKKVTIFNKAVYHSMADAQSAIHQNESFGAPVYD